MVNTTSPIFGMGDNGLKKFEEQIITLNKKIEKLTTKK